MSKVIPVVLSGGAGTRLWPASRSMYPKQLMPLTGSNTMLQDTVLRSSGIAGLAEECIVICNESHRFLVSEQLREIKQSARVILEPEGRNTAPAAALAALLSQTQDDDPILLVMPADHVIQNSEAFRTAVACGIDAANDGKLVTFGIVPTRPETGYGYIKSSASPNAAGAVESFVEKPDLEKAKDYFESGDYYWNAGIFLFRASVYLQLLDSLAPEIHAACQASAKSSVADQDFVRPQRAAFLGCPNDSIDYAVMEKSDLSVMVPLDAGWSDVGDWASLHSARQSDSLGNTMDGDIILYDCKNSMIQAESMLVTAVGMDDTIIVQTKDSVLVARKDKAQDVRHIVERLKSENRTEANLHRQVFRPWGSYDGIDGDDGFQVKRLIVNPGAILSLQKHARRAEHWVVVRGKARITRNDEEFDLGVNESTYIAIGDIHRISNPFSEPVHIIEVQCGDYLGEDDIVRLEDDYGREGTNT
jgi:mannose-1-phosphate guanylyltransferase/mannose-6-phosphate isomerase